MDFKKRTCQFRRKNEQPVLEIWVSEKLQKQNKKIMLTNPHEILGTVLLIGLRNAVLRSSNFRI